MKFISPYFGSEYSFAHFKNRYDSLTKIFFLPNFEILLMSYGGNCSRVQFDRANGGECTELASTNFIFRDDVNKSLAFKSDIKTVVN
jgi:hypothetical protein